MRLLLVEDNRALSHSLRLELERAGYAVDLAENGLDAEHLGREVAYDLVVLDLGLPDRSGLEVLRSWRTAGISLPVLVLTARDAWQERVAGFKAGADDYLGKPFHSEELLLRLSALARRSKAQMVASPTQAGLVLDETRQAVQVDQQWISLTGVEFRLLRYFMLHPGQVLSKTELTEHIYDFDSDKDSNVLEVYVNRLRRKLGRELITTRRGQGYVFGDHQP